jgi:hypothetical protein
LTQLAVELQKVIRLPKEARPQHNCQMLAIGRDGIPVTVFIQADGWVFANPQDSPISLDGIAFTVD